MWLSYDKKACQAPQTFHFIELYQMEHKHFWQKGQNTALI